MSPNPAFHAETVSARTPASSHPVWHAGELRLQQHAGSMARMDKAGRVGVRDHLLAQHQRFFPLLPLLMLGAVDANGDVWATARTGSPGFVHAPDEHRLHVATPAEPDDPAQAGLADGLAVGLLGVELSTRRRNRLNGRVDARGTAGFDVVVEHSFGNCPQYIQLRDYTVVEPEPANQRSVVALDHMDELAHRIVSSADTFFVASYVDREDGHRQVDVSHRGGRPGFVRIGADGVLTIPDFAGNMFFNTLGNFLVNPRAGLLFIDFASGSLLQMAGHAEVILDSPEIAAFRGAERLWRFTPGKVVRRPHALPLRWRDTSGGASPNSLLTGNWTEAEAQLQATALGQAWRPFRVTAIVQECEGVRSFYLEPADDAGRGLQQAGQHLPIRVTPAGAQRPLVRTYTLSNAPSDGVYRVTVKEDGEVSRHLHRALRVGDLLEARAPAGAFTIDAAQARPAVFLVAGIGVTPAIAMLRHIVFEGLRKRRVRPSWLFFSARSRNARPFDDEVQRLVEAANGAIHVFNVVSQRAEPEPRSKPASSGPGGGLIDKLGNDARENIEHAEIAGRIDMDLLKARLPFGDFDFYLCGPPGFMQDVYDGLRGLNIADDRIHAESFGPGSMQRRTDAAVAPVLLAPMATRPVHVHFAISGKSIEWQPGQGSLLSAAESIGLAPEFSCRVGSCGTCRTKIASGTVTYASPPAGAHAQDEALLCCAYPAEPEASSSDIETPRGLTLAL